MRETEGGSKVGDSRGRGSGSKAGHRRRVVGQGHGGEQGGEKVKGVWGCC